MLREAHNTPQSLRLHRGENSSLGVRSRHGARECGVWFRDVVQRVGEQEKVLRHLLETSVGPAVAWRTNSVSTEQI